MVEISKDYIYNEKTLKPYQKRKDYPPSKILSFVKQNKKKLSPKKKQISDEKQISSRYSIKEDLLAYIYNSDK